MQRSIGTRYDIVRDRSLSTGPRWHDVRDLDKLALPSGALPAR